MKKKPIARNLAKPKGPVFRAPQNEALGPAATPNPAQWSRRSGLSPRCGKWMLESFQAAQRADGGALISFCVNLGCGSNDTVRQRTACAIQTGFWTLAEQLKIFPQPIGFVVYETDLTGNVHAHGLALANAEETLPTELAAHAATHLAEAARREASAKGFKPTMATLFSEDNGLSSYLTSDWPKLPPESRLIDFFPSSPNAQLKSVFQHFGQRASEAASANARLRSELAKMQDRCRRRY